MGLLGNLIQKVGQSTVGQVLFKPGGVVDIVTKPAQIIGTIVSNPVTTLTQGYGAAKQKVLNESVEKSIGKVVLNTGIAAGAVLTGGTSVGRTTALNIGKKLIPTTPKGIITTAVAAPIAVGVLSKTSKPLTTIAQAPGKLTAFGADVGTFIDEPSLKNAENILKQNPGVSIALGTGAVIAGAGALVSGAGALTNIQTKEAVQDLTTQLSNTPSNNFPTAAPTVVKETPVTTEQKPFTPSTAVTPATAPVSAYGKKATKRKAQKKVSPSINQKVNVIVQNKNTTTGIKQSKNYLKRSILA